MKLIGFGGAALLALAAGGCGTPAAAQPAEDGLIEGLHEGATLERYVAELVGSLRMADVDGDGLDRRDVDLRRDMMRAQSRAGAVSAVLGRDLDGDFKVTRAELERTAPRAGSARTRDVEGLLARIDTNQDGVMTLAEMAASSRDGPEDPRLADLLALDPDRDGRITAAELRRLAEVSFASVDSDGDERISGEEYAAVADRIQAARIERSQPRCTLPPVPSGARLVVYGGYEGDSVSSVAIGGPNEETNLIDLVVEPGSAPLYLVLTSYESMIWRVRGATGRVAQVVIASAQQDEGGRTISGVVGLPSQKVTIAESNCPRYFYKEGNEKKAVAAALRRATGRHPDAIFGAYSAQTVALPSGSVVRAERDTVPPPPRFDPDMWREAVRFWPGGLVQVDPRQVVARARVQRYQVLPSQMGLAQLLGAGAIVRVGTGNAFKIVRPIPHLPPSMGGAHSVTLILAAGVKLPPGDPVHSCIISEEKKAPLTDSAICGLRR